jgi:hypothetical protein
LNENRGLDTSCDVRRENRREIDPQTARPRAENRERAEKSGAVGDAAAHTSRDRTNLSNGTPAGEKSRTGGKIESGRRRRGARFPRLNKLIAVEPKPGGGCKAYAWRHTSGGPQEGRPEAATVSRRRTGPTKTRHGDALREEAVGKTAARREKSQRRRRASGGDYAVATVTLAPHRVNQTGPGLSASDGEPKRELARKKFFKNKNRAGDRDNKYEPKSKP